MGISRVLIELRRERFRREQDVPHSFNLLVSLLKLPLQLPYSALLLQKPARDLFLELVHSVVGEFGPVCPLLLQLNRDRPFSPKVDGVALEHDLAEVVREIVVDLNVVSKPFKTLILSYELGVDPLAVDLKCVGVLYADAEEFLIGSQLKGDGELLLLLCDKGGGWALLFTHKKDILYKAQIL
jgi:hypothetical protein